MHTLATNQPRRERPLAFAICLPSQKSIAVVEKRSAAKGIPCAIKNVTGDDEEVLAQRPGRDAPVERDDDYEKDDESERIKKHGEKPKELICRTRQSIYASHIEGRFFRCCFVTLQDKEALQVAA